MIYQKWAKYLGRHFIKEDIWIANKYMKRYLTFFFFFTKETNTEATKKYYYEPIEWLKLKD